MSRKWALYACIAVAVALLGLLLSKTDRDVPKGETRLCSWGLAAVDVRSVPSLSGGPSGEFCDVSADGLKLSLKVFEATASDTVVNMKGLKEYYATATKASGRPAFDVSPAKLLSLPYLLFRNRAPATVYSAPDQKGGFIVAELTDRLVIAGFWVSDRPTQASQISNLLSIRINPEGDATRWAIWAKLGYFMSTSFACLPFAVIWFGRSIFRSIDQWLNMRTMVGLMVYAGLIPATLLGFVWIVFLLAGWSTGLILAETLTAVALAQIGLNLIADRNSKLALTPMNNSDPVIFHTFRATTGTLEVANVELPVSHSVDIQMWFPRRVHCSGCGMDYVVYVPAKSSQPVPHEIRKESDFTAEMRRQLYLQAAQAAPQLVNGCIRCGLSLAGAPSTWEVKRDEPFKVDIKFVVITLATSTFAVVLAVFSTPIAAFCEKIPLIGWLLGYVFDELSGLVIFGLTLPLFFLIWHVIAGFADRNVKHGSGPYRMTACPKEGIVFEDIAAERDSICPSCGGQLEPLRRFRITR
jgi:hypothetical protein